MTERYEARPIPGHPAHAWGVWDNTSQTFVPWLDGSREAMERRAESHNVKYQRVLDERAQ